jgi:hypothetical protein
LPTHGIRILVLLEKLPYMHRVSTIAQCAF